MHADKRRIRNQLIRTNLRNLAEILLGDYQGTSRKSVFPTEFDSPLSPPEVSGKALAILAEVFYNYHFPDCHTLLTKNAKSDNSKA